MLNKKTNIEQRMVTGGKPELLNGILEETEELIKIFVTSIKTAEKKKKYSFKVWHRIVENK